jgi:hypothetical protein
MTAFLIDIDSIVASLLNLVPISNLKLPLVEQISGGCHFVMTSPVAEDSTDVLCPTNKDGEEYANRSKSIPFSESRSVGSDASFEYSSDPEYAQKFNKDPVERKSK